MNAETMIKEYWDYKREADILRNQLQNFEGVSEIDLIEALTFAKPQEESVQRSGKSDKTAKIALNYSQIAAQENEDLFRFIAGKYRSYIEEIKFFESSVELLPNNLSAIIKDMVYNKLSWYEIEKKYCISRRTVSRHRRNAINKLNELYNYREALEIEYMLS